MSGQMPKRPSLASRHSSGAVITVKQSPNENLSSSAQQRQRNQRHVRMGPSRTHSFSRNPAKLTRLTPSQPSADDNGESSRAHMKRNSSNLHLTRNVSATALKKNHSETSLKKNKSNGQLTRLSRPAPSKHANRSVRAEKTRRSTSSSTSSKPPPQATNSSIRFDLGDDEEDEQDDGWVEEPSSQSPGTAMNTARNSMAPGPGPEVIDEPVTSPKSPAHTAVRTDNLPTRTTLNTSSSDQKEGVTVQQHPKSPNVDAVTSRLLKRNVSFNAPQISNVSATVTAEARPPPQKPQSDAPISQSTSSSTMTVTPGKEIVSRFLNGGSSGGTPRNTYLEDHDAASHDVDDPEAMRRNKSVPNMMRQHSRSESAASTSGTTTPASALPSRNQQKLQLEREFVNSEPRQMRPPSMLRGGSRFSVIGLPLYPGPNDGRLNHRQRPGHDQTAVEYRRVRLFQNPLADGVKRLLDAGSTPQARIAAKPSSRAGFLGSSGEGKLGLSQSWRSQKSAKSSAAEARRPKVSFQGIREKPEAESGSRRSLDADDDFEDRGDKRDEAREVCRRMWERQILVHNGD